MKEILNKAELYLQTLKDNEGDYLYINKDNLTDFSAEDEPQAAEITQEISTTTTTKATTKANKPMPQKLTVAADWQSSPTLDILYDKIHNCQECALGKTRTKFVFGTGNPNADIMIIGEAPGAEEDAQGLPFVGRSGQLLTKILEAINLSRDDVFIANINKCRPPNNRRPEREEIDKCEPYLQKQIELIKPKFLLSLGLTSVDTLLKKKHRMADMRGKVLDYNGTKMLVTYHPAALLRNPNWKKKAWEDVKLLRRLYDEYLASSSKEKK